MIASILLRDGSNYRKPIWAAGLARAGYTIQPSPLLSPSSHDLLLIWNRFHMQESIIRRYEGAGATVLVAENGYISQNGEKCYALAKNFHNGAGTWETGNLVRWKLDLKPWRENGDFILVLPQRGIGPARIAMPRMWAGDVQRKLKLMTKRPVRVRAHPGMSKEDPYKALEGAWAAVTWGSGAAIKALYAGYPVFFDLLSWIGAQAALVLGPQTDLEKPFLGDRLPMFQRLAWAQWSAAEIESGVAFDHLLGRRLA